MKQRREASRLYYNMKPLKSLLMIQLPTMLIFPAMLWAITPCDDANNYITEVEYLDSLIHRTLQKDLLQQALTLCPNHPEAHTHLAVILALENKNNEAHYHFQQALKTRPDSPQAWFGIGELYYQQNQWPLSLAAYLQVCTTHEKARQRVAELLRDNRYRIADGNRVLNYESLILLYDKKRLQRLHQKVARCRKQDQSIAPDVNTVTAILQPIIVFQIIEFEGDDYFRMSSIYRSSPTPTEFNLQPFLSLFLLLAILTGLGSSYLKEEEDNEKRFGDSVFGSALDINCVPFYFEANALLR